MTRQYQVEMGPYSLSLSFDDATDTDGLFDAIDNDSGDTLRIKGWMIDSIDEEETFDDLS